MVHVLISVAFYLLFTLFRYFPNSSPLFQPQKFLLVRQGETTRRFVMGKKRGPSEGMLWGRMVEWYEGIMVERKPTSLKKKA